MRASGSFQIKFHPGNQCDHPVVQSGGHTPPIAARRGLFPSGEKVTLATPTTRHPYLIQKHFPAFLVFLDTASALMKDGADPHDLVDWRKHQFQAPTTTDARGPCPGMNTLANHGFLPRDGRNITVPAALKASKGKLRRNPPLVSLILIAGLMSSPLQDQFSLTDIGLHGNVEHDASVSRIDTALGNNLPFNEEIFATLANSNPGVDYYNATSAGQVQKARLEDSLAKNPKLRNTIKDFQFRSRESYFYLSTMGDPVTGVALKKYVNILFREERLPLEEGWKISKVEINLKTHDPIFEVIKEASDWQVTPGQCSWLTLAPGASEDPATSGSVL
ncbi:hypothetical protein V5O48_000907 [Marasmius crinis-equi]|uniref:Heme haloperoxidase family profile domain-containing protein n=1 Tax=Marasmius crinis-equi TaxID=585013 RepID=A0ABR3G0L4_9AGAR